MVLIMNIAVHWLSEHMLPCFFRGTFGLPCPGCGLQRGVLHLLQGHLLEAMKIYPPLFPSFFLIGILLLVLKKDFRGKAALLYATYSLVIISLILNFFLKIS